MSKYDEESLTTSNIFSENYNYFQEDYHWDKDDMFFKGVGKSLLGPPQVPNLNQSYSKLDELTCHG